MSRTPFPNQSVMGHIVSKLEGAPSWEPDWPEPIRQWLSGLLRPIPHERPSTTRALEMLLEIQQAHSHVV